MIDKKEYLEAKLASKNVLELIDLALEKLKSARNWGLFDIFGGGFFISMIKREKIRDVNKLLDQIENGLIDLTRELQDIDYSLPYGFNNDLLSEAFDVYFDNIFTDVMVQSQITNMMKELQNLWDQIKEIDEYLENELDEYLD